MAVCDFKLGTFLTNQVNGVNITNEEAIINHSLE